MSDSAMHYIWRDYQPRSMSCVEDWLDESAVRATGLEEGFRSFYEYWAGEEGFSVGENYWCKVVFEADTPLAVIALCQHEETFLVMELVVAPQKRGQGVGTRLLKELLARSDVTGFSIRKSDAVVFPDNTASQRAFEKAGYRLHHTYEDGSALYYVYENSIPDIA